MAAIAGMAGEDCRGPDDEMSEVLWLVVLR